MSVDVADIRARHKSIPNGPMSAWCVECDHDWPCDAIRLADALEESEKERLRVRVGPRRLSPEHAALLPKRIVADIEIVPSGCWLWTGPIERDGYSRLCVGNIRLGHRLLYERLRGPIPAGFHIDHLCRVRHCVNPDHLEAVTPLENTRRTMAPTTLARVRPTCLRGHPKTPENSYVWAKTGYRACRPCTNVRAMRRAERLRAANKATLANKETTR